jgi:VanZ family protein
MLAWTAALLLPYPRSGPLSMADLDVNLRFLFAKSLHALAYAFLTVLTAWLRVPARRRSLMMFLLMGHATLTEVLQMTFESLGRSGSLLDVAIDNGGIAAGLLISWCWWMQEG